MLRHQELRHALGRLSKIVDGHPGRGEGVHLHRVIQHADAQQSGLIKLRLNGPRRAMILQIAIVDCVELLFSRFRLIWCPYLEGYGLARTAVAQRGKKLGPASDRGPIDRQDSITRMDTGCNRRRPVGDGPYHVDIHGGTVADNRISDHE